MYSEIRGRKVILVGRQDCWGVRKFMLQAGRGEVTYKCNGIFYSLSQHRLREEVLLIWLFDAVAEVTSLLIYLPSILHPGFGAHQRDKAYKRSYSIQLSSVCGKIPSCQLFKLGGQLPHSFFLYSVGHVEKVRRQSG